MAIALVMTFDGIGEDEYEGVMSAAHLDLRSPRNPGAGAPWPAGLLSHTAGATASGWAVVDVWASQEAFDRFLADRLGPALQANRVPQPNLVTFEVYNSHTASVPAPA